MIAKHFSQIARQRLDFSVISRWVSPNAKVLDLGCGDGSLLGYLAEERKIHGYGIEKDDANVLTCLENGINVIQGDLEGGLADFETGFFDVVILSLTLQAVQKTEEIVLEMLRVARECIVTVPNFGYWRNRLDILAGRMPVTDVLPYQWYDTPNIHLCTIRDFDHFCTARHLQVIERLVLTHGKPVSVLPNFLGELALYRFQNKSRVNPAAP